MMQQNPHKQCRTHEVQQMSIMQVNMKIESRKAVLIAEMMDEYITRRERR
jgi:hypothetical protein